MVTHDIETLRGLASHVAVLAEGRIAAAGTLERIVASGNTHFDNLIGNGEAL